MKLCLFFFYFTFFFPSLGLHIGWYIRMVHRAGYGLALDGVFYDIRRQSCYHHSLTSFCFLSIFRFLFLAESLFLYTSSLVVLIPLSFFFLFFHVHVSHYCIRSFTTGKRVGRVDGTKFERWRRRCFLDVVFVAVLAFLFLPALSCNMSDRLFLA